MITTQDKRSIAEVILDGDGKYSELLRVTDLNDGTCLIYEKSPLHLFPNGIARVHRWDYKNNTALAKAVTNGYNKSEEKIIRDLNDAIMPISKQSYE